MPSDKTIPPWAEYGTPKLGNPTLWVVATHILNYSETAYCEIWVYKMVENQSPKDKKWASVDKKYRFGTHVIWDGQTNNIIITLNIQYI